MPYRVTYSPKTRADLRKISAYQLQYHSLNEVQVIIDGIYKEIDSLASTPRIGVLVQNAKTEIRQSNVSRHRYKVYYEVVGQNAIRVLRIWPTRSKPLMLVDIEP